MSIVVIRQQLETALAAINAVQIVHENEDYTTIPGTPYQRAQMLFATPANPTLNGFYRELGFLQVTLYYPLKTGSGAAITQAETIREAFPNGRSFVTGKVTTIIGGTPIILPSSIDEDRYACPVRVPFYSNVYP